MAGPVGVARRAVVAAPLAVPLVAALASEASAQPAGVVMDEVLIPGPEGAQLYLRNKRPEGAARASILCVHGATYPASTTFDLPLSGVSWMDYMAGRGFDVWSLDLTGYGRSTRPAGDTNPPPTRGERAVADIGAALAHIRAQRGVAKCGLIGWSWGTTLVARFAADNPALVDRLVLYAPLWLRDAGSRGAVPVPEGALAAYRTVTRAQARERWVAGVPDNKRANLLPPGWYEYWADATFATDPEGSRQVPSVLRAPNGVLQDLRDHWDAGKPFYDPARITVPSLLVLGEWDRDTPPSMATTLFPLMVNAPGKRLVMLAEGTHSMMMERNRGALFQAVQVFLEESFG